MNVGEKRQRTKTPELKKEEPKQESAFVVESQDNMTKAQRRNLKKREKHREHMERINKKKNLQAAQEVEKAKDSIKDEKRAKTEIKVDEPDYPYEVIKTDHCETSQRAYADIKQVLEMVASELGKTPETL